MQTHGIIRPHIEVFAEANAVRRKLRLNWNGFLQLASAILGKYNDVREFTESLAERPEEAYSSLMPEDNGKQN